MKQIKVSKNTNVAFCENVDDFASQQLNQFLVKKDNRCEKPFQKIFKSTL